MRVFVLLAALWLVFAPDQLSRVRVAPVQEGGGGTGGQPTGDVYYVRTDGNNTTCNGLTNASSASAPDCAWLTIDRSLDTADDGDWVRVQAGTYSEAVGPALAGTLESPITVIADGAVTFCRLVFSTGDNYYRFIGFTIDTDAGTCVANTRAVEMTNGAITAGNELWHNVIRDASGPAIGSGGATTRSNNYLLIGNTVRDNGGGGAIGIRGADLFVAHNAIIDNFADDIIGGDNTNTYYLNNFIDKFITGPTHADVLQVSAGVDGFQFITFEGNFIIGDGTVSDEHGVLLSDAGCPSTCAPMNEMLFRRNVWHILSGGHLSTQHEVSGIDNVRNVHDTIVDVERGEPTITYSFFIRVGANGYAFNNINDDAWAPSVSTNIRTVQTDETGVVSGMDYNLAHEAGVTLTFASPWTTQANPQANVDPQFTDRANDDFTLQSGSGAIGTAGPLTATSGSGTGTTFNVASGGGGWFRGPNTDIAQYGGNLTEGDQILVGSDCVTVASVSTDAITVTASFTWADAESVFYGCDSTPDIGAYPFKAGGYALSASYSVSGSTVTITPNDASLVRYVVCYSDNVPYAVDNSSPYTCATSFGSFSANVFPRYATKSATPWVAATP